jgi:CheY-like chemotaxis protein
VQNEDVEDRCSALGAKSYLRKPFEPDQLLSALHAMTAA